jgi:hypothetical protein
MKLVTPRRLIIAAVAAPLVIVGVATAGPTLSPAVAAYIATHAGTGKPVSAKAVTVPPATPRAKCGPGSRPETGIQGRVPTSDYTSGRATKGYTCNAVLQAHDGHTGGFKTFRYTDRTGRVCAFYDGTLLFPTAVFHGHEIGGVHVLDMSDPTRPIATDRLLTVAMNSPHESLVLNQKRGLLAAAWGTPGTAPGVVDIYDVSNDCRHPVLQSTSPLGILGHESGFAPDGRTLYISTTAGPGVTAIDVSNPRLPSIVWHSFDYTFHGMSLNASGTRLYGAQLGGNPGLRILDVSEVQGRKPDPVVHDVSFLTWPTVSIPQNSIAVTIKGHKYLIEFDEYNSGDMVGAGRLISLDDERHPKVVSDLRLAVNQPAARQTDQSNDPGNELGTPQGYAAHYCGVPRTVDPGIVACSFIASGLRVFNIADPLHPREVAYASYPAPMGAPLKSGAYAMSAPTFDIRHQQVWYADGDGGFFVLKLTNGAWPRNLR